MKIDFKDMYIGRIVQIDSDIKQAIYSKKWALKANLTAERKIISDRIDKLD